MLRFWDPRELRDKPWLTAALLCVALLILPTLAWVVAPRVGGFAAPLAPKRAAAAAPIEAESRADDEPRGAAPRPVAAAPAPSPDDDEPGVSGTVVDPDGKPVEGAVVSCNEPSPGTYVATSDPQGRFKLAIEADGCKVTARHDEFTSSDERRVEKSRSTELRLKAGGGIEGFVVDERGAGVSPVMVAIESFSRGGEEAQVANGAARSFDARSGAFALEKLPAGKYVLTASAEGHPPAQSAPIDVDAGRTVRGVKIVVPRGGRLSGRVVDEATKKAIVGAVVSLDGMTTSQANAVKSATTDNRGAFTLEGAPPGPFSIRVAHLDYTTKIVPGITAAPGGAPTQIDVELSLRADGGPQTEMGGIGVRLSPMFGDLSVLQLDITGPAAKAGLAVSDRILRIDGVDTHTLTIAECTQRLRGPAGTTVVVTVKRGDATMDLTITRADIKF
jgi:protocatechuate 3,4-dioxygenase beta subunit